MRSRPTLLNSDWRRIWEYLLVKQPSLQVAEKQNQSDMASLQHMPKKVQILFLQDVTNKNLSTQRKIYGVNVLAVQADVNSNQESEQSVKNVVAKAVKEFGRIDVLINNAQASASGVPLAEHTLEQFNLAIYSGLYAAFLYMRECYPYLKETKGSVINFASGAGLFGNAGQASYAAAKEGIRGLSRVAATEWGKDGINVNIVCPLAFTAQLENFKAAYPEAYEKNLKAVPAGRFGDPEQDIGRVCVHLGSPDFKYMSGETITLEGGLGQRP